MPAKAIDQRIPILLKNAIQENKRSFFVIVGDHGRDQVMNLYYLQYKLQISNKSRILWMYKKDLAGFSSHKNKRKKMLIKKKSDIDGENPFELFLSVTNIRYCFYKDSDKILGQTFGMLVLQDFEAITPNLLARTIETVNGGGIVILLLRTMSSLKKLYTMAMDVHSRFSTSSCTDIVARFNERFILSLSSCKYCLVIDDEMNVLPVSGAKNVRALNKPNHSLDTNSELDSYKKHNCESKCTEAILNLTRTLDQAKAVSLFLESLNEKNLRSRTFLSAGRGRGKSATLGLAIAAAIQQGYSNVFVTSPNPENLLAFFEFVVKGLESLDYNEHTDYDIIQSTSPELHNAVLKINIHKSHRQTIQYVLPTDSQLLYQAEILVIDEAAAIPLPVVKKLLGQYMVFMSSTVHGYEGTGRSLSLKLIQELRQKSTESSCLQNYSKFREITLEEPIRYANGDDVESWLNNLLCLNLMSIPRDFSISCPHPSECTLYMVNRDNLFSYHPVAENFLHRMVSLYSASHYKNTPNDLQMLSDAPAHSLFVLLPPIDDKIKKIPEILCVIQTALEGRLSREFVLSNLSRGLKSAGDLIPWTISQQFQNQDFGLLSGLRIVRIATNPDMLNLGYGSQALEQLINFYLGKYADYSKDLPDHEIKSCQDIRNEETSLLDEKIEVRNPESLPPLFMKLSEVAIKKLDYIGTCFGITEILFNFWRRHDFTPLYIRQTPNNLTGEYSTIMIRTLNSNENHWIDDFTFDFCQKFSYLLGYDFKNLSPSLALSLLETSKRNDKKKQQIKLKYLEANYSSFDLKRLEAYSNNMLDYHAIIDNIPKIAMQYFKDPGFSLSTVQQAILLCIGLQHKTLSSIEADLKIHSSQILAILTKIVKKFMQYYDSIEKRTLKKILPPISVATDVTFDCLDEQVKQDLPENNTSITSSNAILESKQKELLKSIDLSKYIIEGDLRDWEEAETQIKKESFGSSTTFTIKKSKAASESNKPVKKSRKS